MSMAAKPSSGNRMTNSFFRSWVSLLLKIYPFIIGMTVLLTSVCIKPTIELFKHISTDTADLLPADYPEVKALMKIRSKFKAENGLTVVLESEDPQQTRRLVKDITERLGHNPAVKRVVTEKRGWDFFNKYKMLYLSVEDLQDIHDRLDRRIQREKLSQFYVDFEGESDGKEEGFGDIEKKYKEKYGNQRAELVSPDGKIFLLDVIGSDSNTSLSGVKAFEEAIRSDLQGLTLATYHPTMKMYFHGALQVREYEALLRDLQIAGIVSAVLLFLPLLIRFRNPLKVLLIFFSLPVGLALSFGLVSFWIQKLNVSTSFLFAILGGLGVESGIHIYSRYEENRRAGQSREAALLDIYEHSGPSILTSVASVAVTFLLLIFADFRGFSEFGLIAGCGLWVIFLVYFTFFPALLVLFEKIRVLKFGGVEAVVSASRGSLKPSWVRYALGVFSVFTLFSIVVTPKVGFEYDSKKTRSEIPEARVAQEKYRKVNTVVNNPAALMVTDPEQAKAIKAEILKRRDEYKETTTIDDVRSYYDLVPDRQGEKMAVIHRIQKLLQDHTLKLVKGDQKKDLDRFKEALAETNPMTEKDIPATVVEIFRGNTGEPGELLYINAKPNLEMDDGRNAIRFSEDVGRIHTDFGNFYPANSAVIFGTLLRTLFADSKMVVFCSLASVFFFVYLDFRNLKKSLIVMLSILAGVVWVFGLMFLSGLHINFYNMVIIPAIMGMSIDNSIHVYHRYEELGRGSLSKVLATTGLTSLLASLTNASGFIGLLFCHHQGLYSMGLIAVMGLGTCLLSTLVFLPMILQFIEKDEKKD